MRYEISRSAPVPCADESRIIALVTHKGASADGGHYIAWVRKDELQPPSDPDAVVPGSEEWFKFDDDKVCLP